MKVLIDAGMTALVGLGILAIGFIVVFLFVCVCSCFSSTGKATDWDKIVGAITIMILASLLIGYSVRFA